MNTAEIAKTLRKHHGWSQHDLGLQLGVDQATVSRIERGGVPAKPVGKLLDRLAAELPPKRRRAA
jgi:transcriptional regulator with XRE-family HTH domain